MKLFLALVFFGSLFVSAPIPADPPPLQAWEIRDRYVYLYPLSTIDKAPPVAGDTIRLNFFNMSSYNGMITAYEPGECTTWYGYLIGIPYSYFHIACCDNIYIVHAASPAWVYEASLYIGTTYRIVQIDQDQLPQEK